MLLNKAKTRPYDFVRQYKTSERIKKDNISAVSKSANDQS